uniref:Uncharacterized protein n=2 Tax=Oryza TaxID=4527 RepID=Q10A44_ORYSJ|nr:hypothetical protein LOC_Os10g07966 [Oryza sativa Japonica Group]
MAATSAQPRLDPDHPKWIWPGGGRPSRMRRDDASSLEAASGGKEGYSGGVGGADVGAVEGSGCHRQDRVRGGQVARLGERRAEAVRLCRHGTARPPGYGGRGQARRGCKLARQCGYGSDPTRMVMAQPSGVVAGRGAVEQHGPAVRRRGGGAVCAILAIQRAVWCGMARWPDVARRPGCSGRSLPCDDDDGKGVFDLVFSTDGRLIASVSNERGLSLVQPVFTSKTARGHFGTFNALSFSSSARNNKIMEGVSSS